jgi:hypothetical protein
MSENTNNFNSKGHCVVNQPLPNITQIDILIVSSCL